MKQTNPLIQVIIDFCTEFFQRIKTKSPLFFQILSWILGALAMATYLPETVQWVAHQLDLTVPDAWMVTVNWVVAKCATVGLFMSLLTTSSKSVGVTTDGSVLKVTNDKKLPFTSRMEQKSAIKKDVPIVQNVTPVNSDIIPED